MTMMRNRKGYVYFGVGSLLLVLVVIFVVIWLTNKPVATEITQGLGNLSSSVGNAVRTP